MLLTFKDFRNQTEGASVRSFLLIVCLLLVPAAASAQRVITATLNDDFIVTGHGEGAKYEGKTYFAFVTYHKVIEYKGRNYACVGHLGSDAFGRRFKQFMSVSEVKTADGREIVGSLRKASDLEQSTEKIAAYQGLTLRNGSFYRAFPNTTDLVKGARVNCLKGRKIDIGTGAPVIDIAPFIMVRKRES